jgi:hypothetical protein
MNRHLLLSYLVALVATHMGTCRANTWNEPWHKDVVSASNSFGLFLAENVGNSKVVLRRVKHIAGIETPEKFETAGYHMLKTTSASSTDWPFWLKKGDRGYLHLRRDDAGNWLLATPSAGLAPLLPNGEVAATYRVSFVQARVSARVYESTQTCIFQYLAGKECDRQVKEWIQETVRPPAAALGPASSDAEAKRFFEQHAALETAAIIKQPVSESSWRSFLDSTFFYTQSAALSYVAQVGTADAPEILSKYICDPSKHNGIRGYAILLLKRNKKLVDIERLRTCRSEQSNEEVFWPVSGIMDGRVGTTFPKSVRDGIGEILDERKSE